MQNLSGLSVQEFPHSAEPHPVPRADPCSQPVPFLLAAVLCPLITQQYFCSAEQREVSVSALVPEL